MSATLQNLNLAGNTPADRLSFGPPDWTVIHSGTAAALSAGPAGATNKQHWLTHAIVSFSAAPAAGTITVKDGTSVIFQVEFGAHITNAIDLNFEQRPLRATVGAALTVNVSSAGGAVVQTVSATGFTDVVATQTSV
jgi:hypothetical protein